MLQKIEVHFQDDRLTLFRSVAPEVLPNEFDQSKARHP